MTKIGLLSDTHSSTHSKVFEFFKDRDQIWHAGDWGAVELSDKLNLICSVKGVYGNIDDQSIRLQYPENLFFEVENVKVFITHIGGYPDKYPQRIKKILEESKPSVFVCGHSHILRVMFDKKYNVLYLNPGAAGNYGFHKFITALRFTIDGEQIKDLEVLEIPR